MRTKLIVVISLCAAIAGCGHKADAPSRVHAAKQSPKGSVKPSPVVYPYSIVPGGVESKADIRQASLADPLIAAHYAGVNVDSLETVALRTETRAYVSYRKDGAIYWTRRPVLLAAGEKVLANGKDCIRGRCGNRVSFQPRRPVIEDAAREPVSAVFQTPATKSGDLVLDEILPPLPMMALAPPQSAPIAPATETPGPLMVFPMVPSGAESWPPGPTPAEIPPGGMAPASWMPYSGSPSPSVPTSPGVPSAPVTPIVPTAPVTVVTPVLPNQPVAIATTAPVTMEFPTTSVSSTPVKVLEVVPTSTYTPVTPPAAPSVTPSGPPETPGTPPYTPQPPPTPPSTPPIAPPGVPSTPSTPTPPGVPPVCCAIDTPTVPTPPSVPPALQPTPEPWSMLLLGSGLIWIGLKRRR